MSGLAMSHSMAVAVTSGALVVDTGIPASGFASQTVSAPKSGVSAKAVHCQCVLCGKILGLKGAPGHAKNMRSGLKCNGFKCVGYGLAPKKCDVALRRANAGIAGKYGHVVIL
ncbi:hypothetical protein GCM10009678_82710 [Actinomadura kijaniata]